MKYNIKKKIIKKIMFTFFIGLWVYIILFLSSFLLCTEFIIYLDSALLPVIIMLVLIINEDDNSYELSKFIDFNEIVSSGKSGIFEIGTKKPPNIFMFVGEMFYMQRYEVV